MCIYLFSFIEVFGRCVNKHVYLVWKSIQEIFPNIYYYDENLVTIMDLKFTMESPSLLPKIAANEAHLHFYIDFNFKTADNCYFSWSFKLMMQKHLCFFITIVLNRTLIDHTFLIRQNLGFCLLSSLAYFLIAKIFAQLRTYSVFSLICEYRAIRYLINKSMNIWDGRPPTFLKF